MPPRAQSCPFRAIGTEICRGEQAAGRVGLARIQRGLGPGSLAGGLWLHDHSCSYTGAAAWLPGTPPAPLAPGRWVGRAMEGRSRVLLTLGTAKPGRSSEGLV